MPYRFKKWLIRSVVVAALVGLLIYGTRSFWMRQLRIYTLGLAEFRADEFGTNLPEIDEIQVMALDQGRKPEEADGPDRIHGYSIVGKGTLQGKDAARAASLWRWLPRAKGFSGLCHRPGYGLLFRKGGKVIFETTVCWDCNNFTIPMGLFGRTEYGFDARSKSAQDLLALLQSHVPLPAKP